MSISWSRAFARTAVVCVVTASSLVTAFASHAAASTVADVASVDAQPSKSKAPHTVSNEKTFLAESTRSMYSSSPITLQNARVAGGLEPHRELLAFPPSAVATAGAPLTVVYLHGIHGRADRGCPYLREGASEVGWLVCPEAALRDGSSSFGTLWSWGGDVQKQSAIVNSAIKTAQANGASNEPGVAVGFSQGSYVTLDLVKTDAARFRGLVLLAGPEAHPSASALHAKGIKRVALGAGSLDAAYAPLRADVKRLRAEGMDARFFDLGKVGHTYAAENTAALHDAIVWAAGGDVSVGSDG